MTVTLRQVRENVRYFIYNSYIRHIHKSKTHYCAHWSNHRLWVISCSTSKPYLIFTCFYLFRVSPAILKMFYSGAIESVLTQCISVWYSNATNQDCKALQRVVCFSWTHPCLYYYLLSPQYTVLHNVLYCTFYSLFYFFYLYLYIFSCVVTYFVLSIERTCPDSHFTTDYILYNWVCDE